MCGHKRRAARCGGAYGAGYHAAQPHAGRSAVLGLIEGIQQMRLASQQRALDTTSTPVSVPIAPRDTNLPSQTKGVVYDLGNVDGKRQMPLGGDINFEVLPTYEQAASVDTPRATTSEGVLEKPTEAAYVPTLVELPTNVNQSFASRGLSEFNAALTSYREGGCCGKGRAKRAARNLVREIASQEVARLEAVHGPLACRERKQVRRDLKPVKTLLKSAVKEIKRERAC